MTFLCLSYAIVHIGIVTPSLDLDSHQIAESSRGQFLSDADIRIRGELDSHRPLSSVPNLDRALATGDDSILSKGVDQIPVAWLGFPCGSGRPREAAAPMSRV